MPDSPSLDGLGPERQRLLAADPSASSVPVRPSALREAACASLDDELAAYLEGGASDESTVDANRRAFDRWRIRPRALRDVSERTMAVEFLGRTYPAPIFVAPIGGQAMFHPDGERPTARAAASLGLPFTLSTVASVPIEEIADEMGNSSRWFQLYWSGPEVTQSLLDRAEATGYEAVVLTVDTPVKGWRERELESGYTPSGAGVSLTNFRTDEAFRSSVTGDPDGRAGVEQFKETFDHPDFTWNDLETLLEACDLPVLLKGIVHPGDARRAVEAGVSGLVVSTHGGRQIGGGVGALDALPGVVEAVNGEIPVLFDSGVRRGVDVFKALALGASAVFVGRPVIYGLVLAGEAGVRDVLLDVLADLDLTMAVAGVDAIEAIDRDVLVRDGLAQR